MTMIDKAREWLEKQGFSLEMRAASAFRVAGFEVRQSTYYTDPETNKPREIDVEAIVRSSIGFLDVRFFVECKSSDKPWVLLCSADTLTGYNRLFAFGALSRDARDALGNFDRIGELIEKYPWVKKDGVVAAYSLRQAFNDKDVAYAAAMNVANASHMHCRDKNVHSSPFSSRLNFAFPVIVVDTPLIHCSLDAGGQPNLREVEQGEFLFTGHELGTCIRIVTMPYLPIFAKEAKVVAEQLKADLKDREDELLNPPPRKRKIQLDRD